MEDAIVLTPGEGIVYDLGQHRQGIGRKECPAQGFLKGIRVLMNIQCKARVSEHIIPAGISVPGPAVGTDLTLVEVVVHSLPTIGLVGHMTEVISLVCIRIAQSIV